MSETTNSPVSASSTEKKEVGKAITKDIPKEVKDFGVEKLSHDVNGNIRQGADGKPLKVAVIPARENGSYKGRVIANGEQYLVQAIGKDEKYAVVHEKANLEMVSNTLKWRDENKRLGQSNIQIHYNGEKAKVFPYSPDRAAEKQVSRTAAKEATPLTKEEFQKKAQEFSKTIEDPKKRDAFLKTIERQTAEAKAAPAKAAKSKTAKAVARKVQEMDLER
jgi:hypothetical protein